MKNMCEFTVALMKRFNHQLSLDFFLNPSWAKLCGVNIFIQSSTSPLGHTHTLNCSPARRVITMLETQHTLTSHDKLSQKKNFFSFNFMSSAMFKHGFQLLMRQNSCWKPTGRTWTHDFRPLITSNNAWRTRKQSVLTEGPGSVKDPHVSVLKTIHLTFMNAEIQ